MYTLRELWPFWQRRVFSWHLLIIIPVLCLVVFGMAMLTASQYQASDTMYAVDLFWQRVIVRTSLAIPAILGVMRARDCFANAFSESDNEDMHRNEFLLIAADLFIATLFGLVAFAFTGLNSNLLLLFADGIGVYMVLSIGIYSAAHTFVRCMRKI